MNLHLSVNEQETIVLNGFLLLFGLEISSIPFLT